MLFPIAWAGIPKLLVLRLARPAVGSSLLWKPTERDKVYIPNSLKFNLATGAASTPSPAVQIFPNDETDSVCFVQPGVALAAATTYHFEFHTPWAGAAIAADGNQRYGSIPQVPIIAGGQLVVTLDGGAGTDQFDNAVLTVMEYKAINFVTAYNEDHRIAEVRNY